MVDSIKTIINGLKIFISDKIDSIKFPKPNYNENDPNSIYYVQNRPFYDYIIDKTFTFYDVGKSERAAVSIGRIDPLLENEVYIVTVNGESFEAKAILLSNIIYLFHPNNTTQDQYNNCIIQYPHDNTTYSNECTAFSWWDEGSTVSISGPFRVFKQLDDKYYNAVKSINGNTGDVKITAESIGAVKSSIGSYLWTSNNLLLKRNWIGFKSGDEYGTGIMLNSNVGISSYSDDNGEYILLSRSGSVILRCVANPIYYSDAVNLDYLKKQLATKVSSPDIATVGQTIVVKSIDKNGMPTAWEAIDLPSINGLATENYVDNLSNTKISIPNTASVGDVIVVDEVDENDKPTKFSAVSLPNTSTSQIDETELNTMLEEVFA